MACPYEYCGEYMKLNSLLLGFLLLRLNAFSGDRAAQVLVEHQKELIEAATTFGISPRLLASIVYAEHSLNVKPGEDILDKVLALSGYNASIGVAQIKVETARWTLMQLENPSSVFHDERAASKSRTNLSDDLAADLTMPRTNLMFAAAYVAMIVKLWHSILTDVSFQNRAVGVVATLYSLGLARADGSLRQPHPRAAMNRFGEAAQGFYDSFELLDEYSRE